MAADLSPTGNRWKKTAGIVLVNGWLVYHLFAVVTAPASVGPASPLEYSSWKVAAPYLQTVNLNHGYHYFTPEPEGSVVVSYTLEFTDGRTETGRFPDRSITPRLMYHRHYILADMLGAAGPEQQKAVRTAFARNLCRRSGAERVTLSLVRHSLSSMEQVLAGMPLDDSSTYTEEPLGTFSFLAGELQP